MKNNDKEKPMLKKEQLGEIMKDFKGDLTLEARIIAHESYKEIMEQLGNVETAREVERLTLIELLKERDFFYQKFMENPEKTLDFLRNHSLGEIENGASPFGDELAEELKSFKDNFVGELLLYGENVLEESDKASD